MYWLIKSTDFQISVIADSLSKFDFVIILLLFIISVTPNIARTYRFYFLHNKKIKPIELYWIVNIYQFYSNILPYRAGELSYIYLLRKHNYTKITESGGALFYTRLVDFFTLFLFILVSTLVTKADFFDNTYFLPVIFLITFLTGLIVIYPKKIIEAMMKIISKINFKLFKSINIKLTEVVEYTKSFNSIVNIVKIFFCSVIIYISVFLTYFVVLHPFGISLTFFEIVIASSFTLISLIVPIQGIANFGTFESSFLLGLLAFNVDKNIALNYIISIHTIIIIIIIMYFIISKIILFSNYGRSIKK